MHDEAEAHSRADGDEREPVQAPGLPEPVGRLRDGEDVVLDDDGAAESRVQESAEVHVVPVEEPGTLDDPVADGAAERDADAGRVGALRECRHECCHCVRDLVRATSRQRRVGRPDDVGPDVRDDAVDVVPGDLEAGKRLVGGSDVQRGRGAAHLGAAARCPGYAVDQQAVGQERLRELGDGAGRQSESSRELGAGERTVPQDLLGDAQPSRARCRPAPAHGVSFRASASLARSM